MTHTTTRHHHPPFEYCVRNVARKVTWMLRLGDADTTATKGGVLVVFLVLGFPWY